MKKRIATFLLAMLMVISMGCARNQAQDSGTTTQETQETQTSQSQVSEPEEEIVLTFRTNMGTDDISSSRDWITRVASEFMAVNPNIKIELDHVDTESHRNKLKIEMAGGNPPDIIFTWGLDYSAPDAEAGMLLDLTPYLNADPEMKNVLLDVAWEAFTYDGKIMGAGIHGFTEGLFYHKEVFAQLGLTKVETYDEFLNAIEAAKNAGITPIAAGLKDRWAADFFAPMIFDRMCGYDMYQKIMNGEEKFLNDDYVLAAKMVQELAAMDAFSQSATGISYAEAYTILGTGQALLMGDGSWSIQTYQSDAFEEGTADKIGFINFPAIPNGKGDQKSLIYGVAPGYALSGKLSGSREAAAVSFFKKMMSKESMISFLEIESPIVPIAGEIDMSNISSNLFKEVMVVLSESTFQYDPYNDTMLPGLAEVWHDVHVELMDKISGSTAEELLQRLDDAYNEFYQ